jgi:Rod binding domain-containing protein
MLRDEYAKIMSRSSGVGVADAVMRELLRAQEVVA